MWADMGNIQYEASRLLAIFVGKFPGFVSETSKGFPPETATAAPWH